MKIRRGGRRIIAGYEDGVLFWDLNDSSWNGNGFCPTGPAIAHGVDVAVRPRRLDGHVGRPAGASATSRTGSAER